MTGPELRRALRTLGWSQKRAAKELAVLGGQQRISDWCRGKKKVPGYIAAHVVTHQRLWNLKVDHAIALMDAVKEVDELRDETNDLADDLGR